MSFCSDVAFRKAKKSNVFNQLTLELDWVVGLGDGAG